MTLPPPPGTGGGEQVDLSTGVEGLLIEVVADGFVVYCCGPKAAPNALIACYKWQRCVDLVTIRDFERVTTARVPVRGRVDIFAPPAGTGDAMTVPTQHGSTQRHQLRRYPGWWT